MRDGRKSSIFLHLLIGKDIITNMTNGFNVRINIKMRKQRQDTETINSHIILKTKIRKVYKPKDTQSKTRKKGHPRGKVFLRVQARLLQ